VRVAFFLEGFPRLSETFILSQITGLIDRGLDVDIFASRPALETPSHPEVELYGLRSRTHYREEPPDGGLGRKLSTLTLAGRAVVADPAAAPKLARLAWRAPPDARFSPLRDAHAAARCRSYDIVHAHYGRLGTRAVMLRELGWISGRIVTSFHAYDISSYIAEAGPRAYGLLFDEGNLFLPISLYAQRKLLDLGCPKERLAVHRMGVDCQELPFRAPGADGVHPTRFVGIGRLVEKKGFECLIDAFAKSRARERATLTIVGDGPLRGVLSQRVVALGLVGSVSMVGWQTQPAVRQLLTDSDILVAPSVTARNGDEEGIPVTIMEAMATGLPVISTWHAGIPELVSDGVSGLLVPERDSDALATCLDTLHENQDLWPGMAAAGREIVEQQYDVDALNDELVQRYERLVE
jgi:colanic acid/amylovoran biosynthesis glycosyltransferase